jgi:hypothetical protein
VFLFAYSDGAMYNAMQSLFTVSSQKRNCSVFFHLAIVKKSECIFSLSLCPHLFPMRRTAVSTGQLVLLVDLFARQHDTS